MRPSPDVRHVQCGEYKDVVYDPAEDSFALMDALEADADALKEREPTLCIEIGSGSGAVSVFLAQILGPLNAAYVCTDISKTAATCTEHTAKVNGVHLEPVVSSTVDAIAARACGAVDVLLFNPPYVATSDAEEEAFQQHAGLGSAWAGGTKGTALVDWLLQQGTFAVRAIYRSIVANSSGSLAQAGACTSSRSGKTSRRDSHNFSASRAWMHKCVQGESATHHRLCSSDPRTASGCIS